MFWRRRSSEMQIVAQVLGEARTKQAEEDARTPGRSALAHLAMAAAGVAQRFNKDRPAAVARLQRELDTLRDAHPSDWDRALLGYGALGSVLDKGVLGSIDEGLFLTVGEQLHARAPLYEWIPIQEWRTQLPQKLQPEVRMWAWHHLCICSGLRYPFSKSVFLNYTDLRTTLLTPEFTRILTWVILSGYRDGWIDRVTEQPGGFKALPDASKAAAAGVEVLVEHFDGGRALDFHSELLTHTRTGEHPVSQAQGLVNTLEARGDGDLLPPIIREAADGHFSMQTALIDLIEASVIAAVGMAREMAGQDLRAYQQVVMRDPATVLLQ